jgi:hypothetical protein
MMHDVLQDGGRKKRYWYVTAGRELIDDKTLILYIKCPRVITVKAGENAEINATVTVAIRQTIALRLHG